MIDLYHKIAELEGWQWDEMCMSFDASLLGCRPRVFISTQEAAFRLIEKYSLAVSPRYEDGEIVHGAGHWLGHKWHTDKDLTTAIFKAVLALHDDRETD